MVNMSGIVDGVAVKSEKSVPINEGDYKDAEGLWCCGKCNTRKQVRLEIFDGRTVTPMCLCKCMKEARDAEIDELVKRAEADRIKQMRRTGFPDAEMSRWTFDKDDGKNEKVSQIARNYAKNFAEMRTKGKGLLLYGTVGTGKTFLASCIANKLIDENYPCLVTNFARLINTIQGMFDGKQEYIDSLDKFELLVIDDLASERDTEYMNEIVYNIIDARYRSGKPLIVTTNLTAKELSNPAEIRKQRVYSRLLEMCVPIEVKGADRRKKRQDEDVLHLLGL